MPNIILGSGQLSGGYEIDNSLRFDDGSGDNLSASSFGTPTSATTYTLSWWIKKASNGEVSYLFGWYDGSRTNSGDILFDSNDNLAMYHGSNDGNGKLLQPTQTFRDSSAWYHMVWSVDTTQSTASNRIKFYVNGSQVTDFSSATYPDQNAESKIFHDTNNRIGSQWNGTASTALNGYLAEVVFIDGQALTPTSFGETDSTTNNWVPKDVSGLTFGNNGFHLPFQNASALGQDDSGNGNNFTVNNITSIDQCVDTCTNNFATMNSLQYSPNTQFSDGNLTIKQVVGGNAHRRFLSTLGVSQGKYYWETKCVDNPSTFMNGISDGSGGATGYAKFIGELTNGVGYYGNGNIYKNGSSVASGLATFSAGDIINIALDLDNNYIYFGVNGTWINSGDPTSGSSGTGGFSVNSGNTYFAGVSMFTNNQSSNVNFGNAPFSISSGNTDYSGLGNFEYEVPSGYRALCTKNIGLVG